MQLIMSLNSLMIFMSANYILVNVVLVLGLQQLRYCCTIYVGETISILLCFMLNTIHCSTIYLYKKLFSVQCWNARVKLGCVLATATDISSPVILYHKLWGSLFHTGHILSCDSLLRHISLTFSWSILPH